MNQSKLYCTLFAILLLAAMVSAQMTDPYAILLKNYDAIGGLDKLKARKTAYVEGSITIERTGLEGTFKQWSESPIKSRQEVDLTIIKQMSGDNGEFAWTVDQNGKVQILRDEITLKNRKLGLLEAEYDFLNRDSKNFTVTLEGIEPVEGHDCYKIKLANSINEDVTYNFYDVSTFMHRKSSVIGQDAKSHTTFSDYREVDGILMPFYQKTNLEPTGMVQTTAFTKIVSNIAIDPELFEPPGEDVEDFVFANGKSAEDIPFRFIENHVYLDVTVNGKTYLFVLDSGAGSTVLDRAFAKKLGLEIEGEMKGQGVGNLVDVSFATLPPYSLPGLEFTEQKVAVIDIGWLFFQSLGLDVVGILGYDFLSRVVTRVDYANELLSFYHPDSFSFKGEGSTIIEAPVAQSNMFSIPMTVDGVYEGKWNFDLGASGSSFHYPYAEKNEFLDRDGVERMSFGAGGSSLSRTVPFDSVTIVGHTFTQPLMSFPLQEGKGAFAGQSLIGNLGNDILRRFVIHMDYKKELLYFEIGDDYDREFPLDKSGMQLMYNQDTTMYVFFVADDTPAQKAGFMAGDVLVAVNDIDVKNLNGIIAMRALLRQEDETKLTFDILRDGEPKTLKLTLKDLYD